MEDEKRKSAGSGGCGQCGDQTPAAAQEREPEKKDLSPTWAQDCIQDIDDWIESQGIYLRQ